MKLSQHLIVAALLLVAGCSGGSDETAVKGRWYRQSQVDLGAEVYAKYCITCHAENAAGTASWREKAPDGYYPPPPLDGTAHAWHHPLSVLKRVVDEGGVRLGGKMPGFKGQLNEQEKLAVIAYFQNFWSDDIYNAWLERDGLN